MVLISSGTAFGDLSFGHTDSLGRTWANPFSPELLNKDYYTQDGAFFTNGYTFATMDEILESAAADGYGLSLYGVTIWLTDLFFNTISPTNSGSLCEAGNGCDIRTSTQTFPGYHAVLYSDPNVGPFYTPNQTFDFYTGIYDSDFYWGIGALGYKLTESDPETPPEPPTIPEPSMIGLLGSGLMLMVLAAYRRKQK